MYIILVYDVDESRVAKVNKYLKKYLLWRQNSVFEGELSDVLIERMIKGLKKIIIDSDSSDSVVIYKFKVKSYIEDIIIGSEKGDNTNII